MTRNAGYTALLEANFPPPAGFRWEGYISTDRPFDPAVATDRTTRLEPEFVLPAGADGAPFAGPFRWRAVVGFRATGAGAASPGDPVVCDLFAGTVCFDSPAAGIDGALSSDVSDLGVLAGRGTSAGQGETAVVVFPVVNRDGGGLGARTVALSASSDLPGATSSPTAASVSVPANGSAAAAVRVHGARRHAARHLPRDPGRLLGSDAGAAALEHGHDHRRRPDRPGDPRQHARPRARPSRVGARVRADYACADQPNGTGVRTCAGPVATGSAARHRHRRARRPSA